MEPTPSAVEVDAARPLIGRPVQLVSVPEAGVPSAGVTNVGDVANTNEPVPVSSEITPRSSLLVVAANTLSLFAVNATVPVASGRVIVLFAVGSVTVSVVLLALSVAPSKIILTAVGLPSNTAVLFLRTKSPPVI